MVENIYFTKEDKLAILKILIEINNHYSHRIPQASKIIQETAVFLKIPNGIYETSNLSILEAREILKTTMESSDGSHDFITELLSYILGTSNYGVYKEWDKIYDREDYEEYSQSEEFEQYKKFLQEEFQEEWKHAFEIFGDMFGSYFPLNCVAGMLLCFREENPLKDSKWRLINASETKETVTELIKMAERGDASSQYELSIKYFYGKGVECDGNKAIDWMQKAARQDCADAQYELARCYDKGKFVEQNHSIAFYWYEKASHNGHSEAMINLGICYSLGQGCTKNCNQAIAWWEKSASLGNANAFYNLGNSYAEGEIVKQDISKATELLSKATELGCQRASFALAMFDEDYCNDDIDDDFNNEACVDEFDDINKIIYSKAEQGDVDSQFELGVKYANGTGVQRDYEKAAFWFEKAAIQGHETAQYNIAQCYEKDLGVVQNYSIAFRWYQKAAEQGDVDAMTNIALYYYLGQGTHKDYEEAVKWWKQSADLGDAKACFNLGICFRDGTGVLKDLYKAESWFIKANELGHPQAAHTLEQMKRLLYAKNEVADDKLDLILKSTHHQRYQNGIPVMGSQYCNRQIKIEHKIFKDMFDGLEVMPKEGFLITMLNTDMEPPVQHMQPKMMEMVYNHDDEILLKGVVIKTMGYETLNYTDYGITLHLKNRSVVKCVLHMYDRGVNIEYDEFIK